MAKLFLTLSILLFFPALSWANNYTDAQSFADSGGYDLISRSETVDGVTSTYLDAGNVPHTRISKVISYSGGCVNSGSPYYIWQFIGTKTLTTTYCDETVVVNPNFNGECSRK